MAYPNEKELDLEDPNLDLTSLLQKLPINSIRNDEGLVETPEAKTNMNLNLMNRGIAPLTTTTPPSNFQTPSSYPEDLGDEALKSAQETGSNRRRDLMLALAGNQLNQALSQTKVDNSAIEQMLKDVGTEEKNVITRREGKDKELNHLLKSYEAVSEKEKSDPKSEISQAFRDLYKKYTGKDAGNTTSARQLKDAVNVAERGYFAEQNATNRKEAAADKKEGRKENLDFRKEQAQRQAMEHFGKYLEQDQKLKDFKKQELSLDQVNDLISNIKSGNTVAGAALGAKMARAMGEVGVLTAEDVVRYTKSGALARGSADKLKKWITGRPTDATLEEIQQISNVLQENMDKKIQPIYDKYANRLSRIYNIPLEQAYFVMAIPAPGQKMEKEASKKSYKPGDIVLVKGKQYKVGSDGDSLEEIK